MSREAPSATSLMRLALQLARRGEGQTSPNPIVGAVLVKRGRIIGQGWHHRAGGPHAEIEALNDARRRGNDPKNSTLYVTLEPCSTHGRTPPCTDAIVASGLRRVVVAATDPNPAHSGKGFRLLARAGLNVVHGLLAEEAEEPNEAFNYWIIKRQPFVTVKAAMTLDGKIATAAGESKWITGEKARACGMTLRQKADAILVGINTVLADDPSLTIRVARNSRSMTQIPKRRIILDSLARTPLNAKVVSDEFHEFTTIVVTEAAPKSRREALAGRTRVFVAPTRAGKLDLPWLLKRLGKEEMTNLLVEGGGEVNASFLLGGLAHRVAFFYAPKILGGRNARKGVSGDGVAGLSDAVKLREVVWKRLGPDLMLTARIA
jgi:diaminohydroxyphosphoribosylaminopyrimidine deaminase/5-amino-6-(5-phosphoribosylamino)uracil reductase